MKIMKYKKFYIAFSLILAISFYLITFIYYGGFEKSITFNGGIRITVVMPEGKTKKDIEESVKKAGFSKFTVRLVDIKENKYDIEFGPEVRDQLKERAKEERTIAEELEKELLPFLNIPRENVISRDIISASYGFNLFETAMMALLWTLILITVYVSFRFDFSFALGATTALLHDLIITIGFIGVARIEPSIPVVAAVLTLIGYSINDTIVIFDRIRNKIRDKNDLTNQSILDSAIIETFSRTIITSFLTMLSLVAIIISKAESLIDFSWVLIFGIIIGTYSSIAIATPVMYYYEKFRIRRSATT
ncbi:MAG: protein-export membrane protein SecF [Leptospiraceae bacterium]|nr:MAG: protein-export membrane protein SecF [Leptospiraceae bacterium]